MLISRNWLKKYIDLPDDITPDEIRREVSRCVAEIEGYENQGELLDNIVIGKITKVSDHPNADSLKICMVSVEKSKKVQIVCGGENVAKDLMVVVALPGAQVKWHGEGDYITLQKAVIRGEESIGMICASEEIGLGDTYPSQGKEILDAQKISEDIKVGQRLEDVLHKTDTIFEIENKTLSNRPDLWGHYGFAREFAAVYDLELKPIEVSKLKYGKGDYSIVVKDSVDCPRYMGVKIDNLSPIESPVWLKTALESVGIRSINSIVDVTNYVMLELGQPMHAFDADTLGGDIITVRRAQDKEVLQLLDDTELKLDDSMLVIADDKKAVALAGVMGGKDTEVSDKTKSVFLECANFHPSLIRKISTKVGLRTDASMRFEKSLDPYACELATKRALELFLQIHPDAKITTSIIDIHDKLPQPIILQTSLEKIQKVLGSELITLDFVTEKLTTLGFKVTGKEESLEIVVPSWRATKDIIIVEDVIEEILRMYGYDNIVAQEPRAIMSVPEKNKLHNTLGLVKDFCSLRLGMNEVYTYSFVEQDMPEKLGRDAATYLELMNPIAQDTPLVRQTILGNLLHAVEKNLRFYKHFGVYEIGRIFFDENGKFNVDTQSKEMLPKQPHRITGCFVSEDNDTPYYDAKHAVESLLKHLNISYNLVAVPESEVMSWMHPHRCAYVEVLNEKIGVISELHPTTAKAFDIKTRVGIFDCDFDVIVELSSLTKKYKEISKYPAVTLDVSMILEEQITWQAVKDVILSVENTLVKDIELFDVFVNDSLQDDAKKSMAFRIVYQSDEKTLEQEEVQTIHSGIVSELQKVLKAELRS